MAQHGTQRHTVAQHAHLTSPNPLKRVLLIIFASLAALVLAASGIAAFIAADLTTSIRSHSVDIGATPPAPAKLEAYPGAFTMLVIGTDECDESIKNFIGVDRCSGEEAEHHLNDVNIMVHVSESPRRVTVLSFPRDLRVERASCTDDQGNVTSGTSKINTAYAAGGENGLKCVSDTVAAFTGIPIDFAAKLSFVDVMRITDAIGGVEVCVGGDGIHDPNTSLDLEPGPHTLQGGDALQFLRTRYGLQNQSDIARISNQQQYMSKLVQKLRSDQVLSNPVTLLNLATVVAKNMQADTNLADPVRMAQLALSIKDVPLDEITFVSYPVYDADDGTQDVIAQPGSADQLIAAVIANDALKLTATGQGVVAADPSATETPADGTTPTDGATEAPGVTELDSVTTGQTAQDDTCSAGIFG